MITAAELTARRERLQALANDEGLDGVLVFSCRRRVVTWFTGYFSGFRTNFACLWVPADGECRFGIRFLFDHQRAEASSGLEVQEVATPLDMLPENVRRIGLVGGDFAIEETP